MRNKKLKIFLILLIITGVAVFVVAKLRSKPASDEVTQDVVAEKGSIKSVISTTGTVLPKNRLEVKPPVNGRIDSIMVQEGQAVKQGQTLAMMSSTERAALLDAAQDQGADAVKYWKEVYKPIVLLSPIDGEVIVATTQPGQTVTTSDAVVVLSDHLIVRAQVDETDIGKIKLEQQASISLDAYPEVEINAHVDHIYYESQTVNNVTIYKVDLIPEKESEYFRSGMNATVDFVIASKDNALLVPIDAVHKDEKESYVLLKQENGLAPVKRDVVLGMCDDKHYEVLSGVNAADVLLVTSKEYVLPGTANSGTNPFMPKMPSMRRNGNSSQKK